MRVLALAPSLEIDDPDFETLKRAASLMYKRLKKDRRNAKTWAERKADRQVIESTATGSPMRIDDETKGIPLVSNATGAFAGEPHQPARVLHLQERLHARRRLLPLALPRVRGSLARQARPAHRPDRQAGPAHRRPGQDRDVHRAAPAPRWRAHDDHDALPQGRDAPLLRDGGLGRLDPPAQDRRHRPARPHPGRRPRRRGHGGGPARHPHQQRRPDGAPLPRRLQQPRRASSRRRCPTVWPCPRW